MDVMLYRGPNPNDMVQSRAVFMSKSTTSRSVYAVRKSGPKGEEYQEGPLSSRFGGPERLYGIVAHPALICKDSGVR